MNGPYPRFKDFYVCEELTEHFLLTKAELELVRSCRGNANRQGLAILLKGSPNGGVVSGVWGVTGQWMQLRLIVRWSAQRPEFSMGQCPVDRSSQGRIDFQQLFFH